MSDLDFKKFKKIGKDAKHTLLKHVDGHEIKIAHGNLSKKLMDELDKLPMAEGGQIGVHEDVGEEIDRPGESKAGRLVRAMEGSSKRDKEKMKEEAKEEHYKVLGQQKAMKKGYPEHFDDGGTAGDDSQDDQEQAPQEAAPQMPSAADNVSVPSVGNGIQTDQPPLDINGWVQDHANDMIDQDQKVQADMANGQITPKTYADLFENKSTLGKIGTIFGMLIGGAGSGLIHQPNALLQMMNQQIQNDLEAQKSSAANSQNYLRIHMAQELNPALINKAVQEGRVDKSKADLLNYQNQIYGIGKSGNIMRSAVSDMAQKTADALPPTSPNKAPAQAAANTVKAGVQAENAKQAQQTSQQVAQVAASSGFWKQPGETYNDWVQRSMANPTANAANAPEENNLPIPPPVDNKIIPDGAERAVLAAGIPGGMYSAYAPKAFDDITKGRQAESLLQNTDKYFDNMQAAVKRGGKTAFLARNMSPKLFAGLLGMAGEGLGGIPGAIAGGAGGEGIGEAAKVWGKLNQANREYFANAANLEGELASTFKESTAEERASMLQKTLPESGDTPRTSAILRNSFKNQVRMKAQPNSLNTLLKMMPQSMK